MRLFLSGQFRDLPEYQKFSTFPPHSALHDGRSIQDTSQLAGEPAGPASRASAKPNSSKDVTKMTDRQG